MKPARWPDNSEWTAEQISEYQRNTAEKGLELLRRALVCFKESRNDRTADRVRAAISSAKGAVRICRYRAARAWTETAPGSGMASRERTAKAQL